MLHYKDLLQRVNLMDQQPKCPYSCFSEALEFNFWVLFPCRYPYQGTHKLCCFTSFRDIKYLKIAKSHSVYLLGVIHLIHIQIFPKNWHFLTPDKHTYVCVFKNDWIKRLRKIPRKINLSLSLIKRKLPEKNEWNLSNQSGEVTHASIYLTICRRSYLTLPVTSYLI